MHVVRCGGDAAIGGPARGFGPVSAVLPVPGTSYPVELPVGGHEHRDVPSGVPAPVDGIGGVEGGPSRCGDIRKDKVVKIERAAGDRKGGGGSRRGGFQFQCLGTAPVAVEGGNGLCAAGLELVPISCGEVEGADGVVAEQPPVRPEGDLVEAAVSAHLPESPRSHAGLREPEDVVGEVARIEVVAAAVLPVARDDDGGPVGLAHVGVPHVPGVVLSVRQGELRGPQPDALDGGRGGVVQLYAPCPGGDVHVEVAGIEDALCDEHLVDLCVLCKCPFPAVAVEPYPPEVVPCGGDGVSGGGGGEDGSQVDVVAREGHGGDQGEGARNVYLFCVYVESGGVGGPRPVHVLAQVALFVNGHGLPGRGKGIGVKIYIVQGSGRSDVESTSTRSSGPMGGRVQPVSCSPYPIVIGLRVGKEGGKRYE